ncbi:M16 family metallopeptidase [Christiangramia echinicola]|uniref:M16 family metallopeptidase n=1 Tax=Christiangramia echinicola TaxID=279359 RepID=UPI00041B1410|nr:insulinase family protein [Christiangramia echinicola]
MRTTYYLFILALLVVLPANAQKQTPPKGGEPKGFTLPEKEVISYDNGLELVLVPYGSIPKATINITIKTGNIHEKENQVWVSDLLADLMEEGSTSDYSEKDKLAGMGGNLNIGVGTHTSTLSTNVLAEFAPEALKVLSDVLVSPELPEAELERLKNNMKRNITVSLSRPGTQARKDFFPSCIKIIPTEDYIQPSRW